MGISILQIETICNRYSNRQNCFAKYSKWAYLYNAINHTGIVSFKDVSRCTKHRIFKRSINHVSPLFNYLPTLSNLTSFNIFLFKYQFNTKP